MNDAFYQTSYLINDDWLCHLDDTRTMIRPDRLEQLATHMGWQNWGIENWQDIDNHLSLTAEEPSSGELNPMPMIDEDYLMLMSESGNLDAALLRDGPCPPHRALGYRFWLQPVEPVNVQMALFLHLSFGAPGLKT